MRNKTVNENGVIACPTCGKHLLSNRHKRFRTCKHVLAWFNDGIGDMVHVRRNVQRSINANVYGATAIKKLFRNDKSVTIIAFLTTDGGGCCGCGASMTDTIAFKKG